MERPSILVNGYAYPYIDRQVLNQWTPALTFVSPFSYGFTPAGEIVDLNDAQLLSETAAAGTGALMVLTPLDANGVFNSHLATSLLQSEAAQDALISNIRTVLQNKGFRGVDFDFEYVNAPDRDRYTNLVRRTRETLGGDGYLVTVALAPKISSDQKGLLYEGHDYRGMGQAANYALLMTYEWGYTYGPPMAVAPLNQVRRVIQYGLSQLPAGKIWMGMANYGYDWTLPFVQGQSRAEKISNPEAVARAARYGVSIRFDETAQSPYYTYMDAENRQHEVWFENAASWRAKFNLIYEFSLAGIGIWNIMDPFPEGIALLQEMFRIIKA